MTPTPWRQLIPSYIGAFSGLVAAMEVAGIWDQIFGVQLAEVSGATKGAGGVSQSLAFTSRPPDDPDLLLVAVTLLALVVGTYVLARLLRYLWQAIT